MSSRLDTLRREFQRRLIVDVLGTNPQLDLNVHILRGALADFREDVPIDALVGHAEWLAGSGLVKFVHREHPVILRLTDRGRDLAAGRISVEGVAEKPAS